MAKFKVGDRVRIERWNQPTVYGKLLKYENGTVTIEQDGAGPVSYRVDEDGIKPITPNSAPCRSTNAVVQNALDARTARNEGAGKLKVTMQTVTFQGRKSETRILTLAKLEELMKALGHSDLIQSVLQSLTTRGSADFDVDAVEVDVLAL